MPESVELQQSVVIKGLSSSWWAGFFTGLAGGLFAVAMVFIMRDYIAPGFGS